MSILKISFLLRSPSVGYDFKAANDRDLGDSITEALTKALAPVKPVRCSRGSVQHYFYIASDTSAEQNKAAAVKMLETLIPDEKLRNMIVITVTEPDGEEMDKLRQTVDISENADFWTAVQQQLPAGSETKKPKTPTRPVSKSVEKAMDKMEPVEEKPAEPEQEAEEEAQLPLSDRTRNIQTLKNTLLKKVRGQRHAVDVFVEGVFESEMFSSINPERKGPLATFLFTGPSGVGKTFLATLAGKCLDRETLIVDMSEYTSNLSNGRFNGEHGEAAVVTGFVRKNPRGIIVFDEIEKAHINTIYQFLQILDGARMMDHQIRKEVSFRDNIIIITTNAGQALYDDPAVFDLSGVPRQVILDGLRKDVNPQTKEPFFPECITTRMANGRVILFNHLEPYALLQIVKDELALQMSLFQKSTGIKVNYDPVSLAALVLYNGGGMADARTLRGLARNIVVRELQEVLVQLMALGAERVDSLKEVTLHLDTQQSDAVSGMFSSRERMQVAVLTENCVESFDSADAALQTDFTVLSCLDDCKRRVRGVTDYFLLDPLCGNKEKDQVPNDVEDLNSVGMEMFEYMREFMPEIPVYILDTTGKIRSFETLLARGAKGVIRVGGAADAELKDAIQELAFAALVNNVTFSIGRSSKFLSYNCAQYLIDESHAVVSFERLQLRSVAQAGDSGAIAKKGDNNNLKFSDVIGCRAAKEALSDYKEMLEDPRKTAMKGKKMPKGVLLYGPPGTGKTMLAKAMANECNATFIPTTATSFFGSLVGETEQNIKALFRKARKYAPSIIFIDEVDAIGRMRSGSVGSTHNEDALTTFLSEMDGFVTDEKRPVFVLAATNYDIEGESGRVLDPAFVRRFDRKILIPLPDTDDRYALLEKSLKRHGIHFGKDHEKILKNMAKRTGGMNNADLEMINANYARLLGDGEPSGAAYMDSLDAYRFGEVNKMDPEQLRQTACHEAGHALVYRLCGVTPSFLTVVSRGHFGGYMAKDGEKTSGNYTYQEMMDNVCCSLAGRAAEMEVYGETTGNNTGASSDIRHARYYMKISLNDYAMGDKLYARWTQDEIEALMQQQFRRTCTMLREHRAVLDALTDRLAAQKSMDQTQLEEFFTSMNI